ncbi:nitrous oxide reductase accessory protein NosL [Flagellimonas halotolerans]|uniref:Nitrous oxide reductase accessory protein NosL n=1 Tax=Flagellimonas halotolerans TaxID=3112164 RepID=A0ABU6ISZ6_9FLAO|nr:MULTISPECIES: nitrous oxide reductase accessory protein NosL [unclassified Allomuricauda]MEC3966396.1 nitrous oxide reductase accessory protein NosL [Muricauda sp. SYSU M86414]MEC4266261.1 nitrous oxide reductase accessory protein NosL [Muricauda sp. SYSU M84420]
MKKHITLLFIMLNGSIGCSVGPKPIDYGHVGCHYCSMTIVDKQHAAQLVTKKGKVFNFDAIECMMNQLKDEGESAMALFLVNDFGQPGELVDATKATYLISENIPSPMGEYLSAFTNEEAAKETMTKQGGELYTWTEIKNKFKL